MMPSTPRDWAKRLVDLFLSSTALVVLLPALLLAALLIRVADGGSVFYRGVRVGRNGRLFRIFKFRTMVMDAEKIGASSTSEDDPRTTRIGRFLRRGKLDELPQLLNVMFGEMSLVGPRPQVPWAVALYTPSERIILTVQPGITDWASIRFRNEGEILKGAPDPDRAYLERIAPEKNRLAVEYARRRSVRIDLDILVSTLFALAGLPVMDGPGDGYSAVTERWGSPASPEQLSMAYTRYRWAAAHSSGKRVLELACGCGTGLPYLATKSMRVIGGDYTWSNLRDARIHTHVPLMRLDAHQLPLRTASFDLVLIFEAVYYFDHPEAVFAECRRVLAPGGTLLFCLPNRDRRGFNPSPMSTRYYSVPELHSLCAASGFNARVFGGYAAETRDPGSALALWARRTAIRMGMVPKTMAGKAIIKRLVYGRLPTLDGVVDGSAKEDNLSELPPDSPTMHFKNLYVVATRKES
jgi:lipopolysaccharide/colanic/teichoic acid biosynthesis glycosyltransferase